MPDSKTIPSPSLSPTIVTSPPPLHHRSPSSSDNKKDYKCSNCHTTKTPLWRRTSSGTLLCNACGLYYKANNSHRPINLKKPPNVVSVKQEKEKCEGETGHCNGQGGSKGCDNCPTFNNRSRLKEEENKIQRKQKNIEDVPGSEIQTEVVEIGTIACHNCGTTVTPLWRRGESGDTICNACGLYYKLHGKYKPNKLKKEVIKRRKRNNYDSTSTGNNPSSTKIKADRSHPNLDYIKQNTSPKETRNGISLPPIKALNYSPVAIDFTNAFKKAKLPPLRQFTPPQVEHEEGSNGKYKRFQNESRINSNISVYSLLNKDDYENKPNDPNDTARLS
ncbi:hypothetical protein WICMUC_000319 [Wickerhamomyces mucosus]|uniref:GATA-type domain-containing protein n=1 Tax=Wickerhamomyces mucosus TaxID=1378264 RepID=A0A9P8TI34_9ASCO|nr:hypothetical protein WICMUC_000319 [Wickerhamomyces mucosus]